MSNLTRPQYSYNNLQDFETLLNSTLGYLEKANMSNLGDFSPDGKTANAGFGNYTIYWEWFKQLGYGNWQGSPYCAGYVSTMLSCAFGLETAKKLLCGNLYTYCPTGWNQFKAAKRIFDTPEPFDVVFFYSASMGRYSHTGLVVGVDPNGKGFTTIEANTSSGNNNVVRNGGATCKKHYTLKSVRASFGRPDWKGNGISMSRVSNVNTSSNPMYGVSTGAGGLKVTSPNVNLRQSPETGSVVGHLNTNEAVFPSKKVFVNGNPWLYLADRGAWVSGKYLTGWLQEANNKWWYVLPGYQFYSNQIVSIDGNLYFFDSAGYMYIGDFTLSTDETGAIKRTS